MEIWDGTKNVKIPHNLRTLSNFLVFLHLDFSGTHSNTSKVKSTYLNNIQAIWSPKKFIKLQRSGDLGGYEECEESSHFSYPCEFFSIFRLRFFQISFDHLLSVTDLFKQHPSHMMPQKISKSPKKWRFGRVRRMWGFLTFFVPCLIF